VVGCMGEPLEVEDLVMPQVLGQRTAKRWAEVGRLVYLGVM
jgi:hypothetical protein